MESLYAECQCSDLNHAIRFTLDEDDGDVYMETRLNAYFPWWQRIVFALGYVFGAPARRFGHYDCTQLRPEDYERLEKMFSRSRVIRLRNSLSGQPKLHLVGPQNNSGLGDEE